MNEEGISIGITRKDGTEDTFTEFAVVALPFIDMVFRLDCAKTLAPGDQLHLSFNVPVISKVGLDGGPMYETHRYTEDWEYMFPVAEVSQVVAYFRFTKIGHDAWIELLSDAPTRDVLYQPSLEMAVKVK